MKYIFNNAFNRGDAASKKVLLSILEDKEKLKNRMCTVEHPFGMVKWYGGAYYLLCRGKEKASAEIGLSYLAYNLRRVINIFAARCGKDGFSDMRSGIAALIKEIRSYPQRITAPTSGDRW